MRKSEHLKRVWTSVFQRNGRPGAHTGLVDELPSELMAVPLSGVRLADGELAVLASVRDSADWFLLTTERVVWSKEGIRSELPVDAVAEVRMDLMRMQATGIRMGRATELVIRAKDGTEYTVEAEAGHPLGGVWSVLNNIAACNQTA